jgi:hypothetical protein
MQWCGGLRALVGLDGGCRLIQAYWLGEPHVRP